HKQLGITHSFPVNASTYSSQSLLDRTKDEFYELYVRLSSSNNEPDEAGSDGPHEGIVQPLVLTLSDSRMIAAPVIQIDRLFGEFAGGRWVLANLTSSSIDRLTLWLIAQRAVQGASRFEIKTDFASYKPGETPTLSVELFRPKGDVQKIIAGDCDIEVRNSPERALWHTSVSLKAEGNKATVSLKIPQNVKLAPGLYKVEARLSSQPDVLIHENGFWIYDEALLARGKPLTVDEHWIY